MRHGILAFILTFSMFSVQAAELNTEAFALGTTQALTEVCGVQKSSAVYEQARLFCLGYIAAAIDYHDEVAKAPEMGPIACSETATRQDTIDVFLAWAAKNPQYKNISPIEGLMRAASAEWPCN